MRISDWSSDVCSSDLVQVHSTPQADGEHTRLRAHVQTNLASVLRPALNSTASTSRAALAHDGAPRALRLAERAGHAAQTIAQRALNIPLLRDRKSVL